MSGWSIPLDRLAAKSKRKLDVVARKVTFDIFKAVAVRSPVDTGRFRANWNVSFGSPDYGTTLSTNQGRATAEALKALSLPVGGVTYMTNGLPYARELEYGHSRQAPQGMVRVTVMEFDMYVRRALR